MLFCPEKGGRRLGKDETRLRGGLNSDWRPSPAVAGTRPTIPTDLFYVLLPIIDSSYQYLLSQAGRNSTII